MRIVLAPMFSRGAQRSTQSEPPRPCRRDPREHKIEMLQAELVRVTAAIKG